MGLKFTRDFKRIIDELTESILKIHSFYQFFEMSEEEWLGLGEDEKRECARTLADDVFYALGVDPIVEISEGVIEYYKSNNFIQITSKNNIVGIVKL